MKKEELARCGTEYANGEPFDRRRTWSWFGTLTFRGSLSSKKAYTVYGQWFEELGQKEGHPNSVDYVRITEEGSFDGNVRFHVLIGGSRIRCKWDWMLRWVELGGDDALLSYYRLGFLSYILKTANDDSDLEISMAIGGGLWIFDYWPSEKTI
jgi:hypothetical protein